jgi:hypothetical protein
MKPWAAFGLLLLVAVAACGQAPSGGATPIVSPPTSALAFWQGFQADRQPRPIVWLGNGSPQGGFSTDGAKLAAMCGKFALGGGLPKNLPATATAMWPDGTTYTYSGIGALDAFKGMSRPSPGAQSADCGSVNPLVINGARVGTFDFQTDRGKARITSWLFTATGVVGEVAYPALVPAAFWGGGLTDRSATGNSATAAGDGLTITYRFWGAPNNPGPCGADYNAVVAESGAAVAIAIQAISHATPGSMVACEAIAAERLVTVSLANRLGGRVVADAQGNAVVVCPPAIPKDC